MTCGSTRVCQQALLQYQEDTPCDPASGYLPLKICNKTRSSLIRRQKVTADMLWNSGLIHTWCCCCATRELPGPESILAASQSCSRALWTTNRLGQASAGTRSLLWGALTCHLNVDSSTVVSHKRLWSGWQGAHSNTGIFAQAMYPEGAGPGRILGSWTPCAETIWFVLLPSRLLSRGLCRRWAPSSPLTHGAGGRTPALLIFSECWLTSTQDSHQDGGWALGGKGTAQPGIQITSATCNPPSFTQWPQNTITKHGRTAQVGSCWSVWHLHPLHPPASKVLRALLPSSPERSWAPH